MWIGHCHLFMEATWNYSTVPLKSAQSSLVIDSYLEKIRWATSICNSSLEGEGRSINLRFISILASVSQGHLNQTIFIQTVQGRVYFKAKLYYPIWYPINFIRNRECYRMLLLEKENEAPGKYNKVKPNRVRSSKSF